MTTLADYLAFAKTRPALFVNPPEAGFTILLDEAYIRKTELQMTQWLQAKGLPTEWAQVGIVYRDQYTMLLRDAVRFPNGVLGTYIRMIGDETPGVIVFPLYKGQVLLIRHFRHATRTWHLEIPRGFGTEGLTNEENARKELEEEIGARLSRLVSLGRTYPNAGMTAEYAELFFAEVESYGDVEIYEGITELLPTSVAEFERMVRDNEIEDGFTLTAYTLARAKGLL